MLIADKAYDSTGFRQWLRSKGIKPGIPPYERRPRKRPRRGRPTKAGPGWAFILIAFILMSLKRLS
jgi:Transposase DDE domain